MIKKKELVNFFFNQELERGQLRSEWCVSVLFPHKEQCMYFVHQHMVLLCA